MQDASSVIVVLLAAFLGLWPIGFLAAVLHHALARRWRHVGQLALLLPIWTIAASVGLMQVAPFVAAMKGPFLARNPLLTVAAIGLTLFCGVLAWSLLIRSFGNARATRPDPG
jgi:hypothetical protein